ncbi:MAG: ribosomal RNA small subunit methyltransferase A [Chloroflexi bacterium]|nr:MAG: ribosomal RNA small subunit methyltransferase A [Anaerolineaceae bacterium 4572_32.2]RLC80812.1 MAG: ribosomal RNA small subunit methyltransferase A [Chloroflexota bacterium]RLC88550.1 MAG: ribosomal RNA small subunit methyltransferase A [Chloroflexota bacterium]HEY74391.1 ribosomal RNA small subunit methyltransferase A [Thermoflexia bacterium]
MDARGLLRQWNLRPSKELGQNFLCNQAVLEKIIAAAELTPDDIVLEIGAGVGTLTELLAQAAGRVVAVELDERLIPVLQSVLTNFENITLIQGDILALNPAILINTPNPHYKVVANLPYYITSAALRHLLEANLKPQCMVLTVQREVAERITAEPGQMSLLAVSVQFYGRPRLLFRIQPGSFYPAPGVESAVVRVDTHTAPPVDVEDEDVFFRIVRAGFSQRRKQLRNSLSAGLGKPPGEVAAGLEKAGIDSRRRAQALSLKEWARVTQSLGSFSGKEGG